MDVSFAHRGPVRTALAGIALLALAALPVRGQYHPSDYLPSSSGWPCPAPPPGLPPQPPQPGQPPPRAEPPRTGPSPTGQPPTAQPGPEPTPTPPAEPGQQAGSGLDLAGERGGAGAESSVGLSAPNMVGNLLMANRSVSFTYDTIGSGAKVFNTGATNLINPAVADNNSPLPQDRFGFRYNHFTNAVSVKGVSNLPAMTDPSGFQVVPAALKTYDVEQYTFQGEKTFLDKRASVEVRIPFRTTLSSNLDLSAARTDGISDSTISVTPTPEETLGRERNELGDMQVILKGLLYQTCAFAFSAGLSLTIPTANNTHVLVNDYIGSTTGPNFPPVIQRLRDFDVKNETWAASPFLAALYTPGDRFFTQGFVQFDIPVNTSRITYSETTPIKLQGTFAATGQDGVTTPGILAPPFTVIDHIREQALMHIDLGTGYWVVRNPEARWLTGLAPTAELHYTTTLNSADLRTLPGDSTALPKLTNGGLTFDGPEPRPVVGNLRNHVDILDVTLGTTLFLCNRATLATAFSAPLRGTSDRTFDWEFHVQLNYYFGGPSQRGRFAPTF
jgi:hypothetical protein